MKHHSDVHGGLDGLPDPSMFVVALGFLSCLHPGEASLKVSDFLVNTIHNLQKVSLGTLLDVTDLLGFVGVLHEEVSSELPELINLRLLGLHPVKVELADFRSIHSLAKLNVARLDLSNLFASTMLLESKHVIDGSITNFLELIHSPFSILKGRLGSFQSMTRQIDSFYLGKGEWVEASVKRSQC